MKLSNLAFACYLYGSFTDYDKSYTDFLRATNYSPDLTDADHRKVLLIWLNSWGCRQFALEYHDHASHEILSWYNEHKAGLPNPDQDIWQLTETEFSLVGLAYESLSERMASFRRKKHSSYRISIGPTGASKILFAIRPKVFIPWDESIRLHYSYGKESDSYLAYHLKVKNLLETLEKQCQRYGFQLVDLPKILGRYHSSIPKLIDEYHWVTITNNCHPPDSNTLRQWVKWDSN
jgi:hypothetical protein